MGALDVQYPLACNNPERVLQSFRLPIGASGAPGTLQSGGAGWAFTRTGAGTYTFTFPKAVDAVFNIQIESNAGTVIDVTLSTISASAGTGGMVTRNAAGAATDPASGDVLHFQVFYKFKGVD